MKHALHILLLVALGFASCSTPPAPIGSSLKARSATGAASQVARKPRVLATLADTGFKEERPSGSGSLLASGGTGDGSTFAGNDRKAAKISIANAPTEQYDLRQLIQELGSTESTMLNYSPPISKAAYSGRVPEERRNVVVEGYIHFVKAESDNDYHVIFGSDRDVDTSLFLNVEISGLPSSSSSSFSKMNTVRSAFEAMYASQLSGGKYTWFEPIKVRITGSLFFDIDHSAGVVGPTNYRPKTAWEIHPVSKIEFLE